MHIGFITSEYPHPEVKHAAGIATSIKNLAVTLVKKNVDVSVFVYHQEKNAIIEDSGVTVHLISQKRYKQFTWFFYRKHIQNYVNRVAKEKQIDILEAPDWTGITAFMRFKKPLVIRFHGSDAYFCKLDKRKQKIKNYIFEKLALRSADAFIAPTDYAGKETQKIFSLDKIKIKTIHYGLMLENFNNDKPNEYDSKTILYIGTIIRKKGVLELAEIFNKIIEKEPKAKLKLIGSDAPDIKTSYPSTYNLMQSVFSQSAKHNVEYLGKIPYWEVQEHIKKSHVCAFPSFAETLGMVTIESMALNKPVVNTSIGWAKELIDDGVNGFLVHPANIERYSQKILELFKDKEKCSVMGVEARKKVEESFDINTIVHRNIEYYHSIINRSL